MKYVQTIQQPATQVIGNETDTQQKMPADNCLLTGQVRNLSHFQDLNLLLFLSGRGNRVIKVPAFTKLNLQNYPCDEFEITCVEPLGAGVFDWHFEVSQSEEGDQQQVLVRQQYDIEPLTYGELEEFITDVFVINPVVTSNYRLEPTGGGAELAILSTEVPGNYADETEFRKVLVGIQPAGFISRIMAQVYATITTTTGRGGGSWEPATFGEVWSGRPGWDPTIDILIQGDSGNYGNTLHMRVYRAPARPLNIYRLEKDKK